MSIPLIIFLILYIVYLALFGIFALFNLYHMLRFGFASFGSYLVTYGFIGASVLVIGISAFFIFNIDWTQTLDFGAKTLM